MWKAGEWKGCGRGRVEGWKGECGTGRVEEGVWKGVPLLAESFIILRYINLILALLHFLVVVWWYIWVRNE